MANETRKPGSSRDRAAPRARTTKALTAALEHHQAGRLRKAEILYRRVLQNQPDNADALHLLGVLAHQANQHDVAISNISKAIALAGGVAVYHNNLGEAYRALGKLEEAASHYRQALAIQPDDARALSNLADTLARQGEKEEAIAAYRRALAIAPDSPQVHHNLGNVLAHQGKEEEAIACYGKALELKPDMAAAHYNLAGVLERQGKRREAISHYREATAIHPKDALAHSRLGKALALAGETDEAVSSLQEAATLKPDDAEIHFVLGNTLKQQDKIEEAIASFRRATELDPDFAMAHNNLANTLMLRDDLDGAMSHLRRVLELDPDRAEAHYNLGICYQHQGRFGEAVACHQKAIALKPELTRAHYNLVINKSFTPGKEATTRLETLLEKPGLPATDRANLHFAWAKILDDQGSVDEAFSHYRTANELRCKEANFDTEVYVQFVSKVISVFTKDFFEQRQWAGSDSELPVFIIGMPRSGTTLVEQIIASHPQAFGAGELSYLTRMVGTLPATLKASTPYPDCAALIDRETARRLAEDYLDHLRSHSEAAERITDKMPNNLLRLGIIALMFSKVRIIHCRRDPLDTCLSCYFHNIPRVWDYSYDLTHLGIVYRQYERIMAHWRRASPLPMLEVAYEELVADQEGVSRRIIEFCGLEWDDRCLAFHEHDRPIRTLSFWQARQPIYTSSVGRWRQYEKYLGPLKEELGPAPG